MENIFLQTIRKDRDAPYVNRGFYFQYLTVLKKWIGNFIEENGADIYTEVDNDIKEVGDKIVYTQIKCYTASFSLNSSTIKKELFGFFLQYLDQAEKNPELEFHFYTNTSVVKSDMLLLEWIKNQPLEESPLQQQCAEQIRESLLMQLESDFNKTIAADKLSELQKTALTAGYKDIKSILDSKKLLDYLSRIYWFFGNETPEESVIALHAEVMEDLKNEKFAGRPAPILIEALLSEIYRCSQLSSPEERKVDPARLKAIIELKDTELNDYINTGVIDILEVRIYAMHQRMAEIEAKIASNNARIDELISEKEQNGTAQLPKNLTIIPFVNPLEIFGRESELIKLNLMLEENSSILINAGGGMGKSALAKLYLHRSKEEYQHFLWIDCETGLAESIISNETLADRISLDPAIPLDKKFLAVINRLESIPGGGLVILDNFDGDLSQLDSFRNLGAWKILVTSRLRLNGWITHELETLTFTAAKKLYKNYEPHRHLDDVLLEDLFEYIDYNTLAVELIAKTIHLSFDLTLKTFLEYLRSQQLDEEDLDVDLEEDSQNTKLLLLLNKTFNIGKLTGQELFYMEFFAILPSEGITLTDLVILYGKEHEKGNKVEFARTLNSLHRKGLIKRTENQIKMDRIFQESVIYQSRKEPSPFIGQLFHISFLTARLREGIKADPMQALHFVKYSKAILRNIKEPFRSSIYQPLLVLENETLYIRNWVEDTEVLMPIWKNLLERAVSYLGETSPLVGVISNNYALTLYGEDHNKEAIVYFDKAIVIATENNIDPVNLLNMMINRAHIYIREHDTAGFKKIFDEMLEIRKKNNLGIDPSFALQCHILGIAQLQGRNYTSAKENFALAIMSHKELPEDQRNDLNLIMFLCDIAACCLALEQVDTAEKAANEAVQYLGKLNIGCGTPFVNTLNIMLAIAQHKGDEENEKKIRKILDSHL